MKIEAFSIKIGSHQGLALSLYLFILVIDELIRHIQNMLLLFADDIILVDGTRESLNVKVEPWWETLEVLGLVE